MRFAGTLLRNVLAALAVGSLVAWYVVQTAFPLGPELRDALRGAFVVGIAGQLALVAAALVHLSAPLRTAASAGWKLDDAASAAAVATGHRLPFRAAAVVVLASALTSAGAVLALRLEGLPLDLAAAAAGVGAATAILAGLLAYAGASSAAARATIALGAREAAVHGTVRGKILVLGFGLNTIALLLFSAAGYVRYRGDVDREYLAAAVRAQEAALAGVRPGDDAELARQVWTRTFSPAALVSHDRVVRARFGDGDAPFDRAPGARGSTLRVEDGWLVTSPVASGVVASWLPEAPLWPRRRAFWAELAGAGVVVYAATAVLAWLAARAITFPLRALGRAADRIASGDLTAPPAPVSRDELGQLAADFGRMTEGLKGLVVDVQAASDGVLAGAREAGAVGDRVKSGALDEHTGVVAVTAAVEAMEGSVQLVSRGVAGLSEYVAATTQTMSEMAVAFDEVQRKGSELRRTMDVALRDVEHLSAAGRDADARLSELEVLAGHAGGTLGSARASMSTLERAAGESEATAGLVAEIAQRAGGVVEETVHGIETLRAAVSDAHRRIAALGRRSDDIDQVVDFIAEVAGRTNLLSLNASIIAAQAGEHGKAFSVVADQIRELAAQIARSTKSVGDIIRAVREDVEGTAALIDRGDALAAEGVQLARKSLDALGQIQRSTIQGRETASAIHAAVDAHARSSREVGQLVESVANGSRTVATAVQLVGRSVAGVTSVSKSVNAMAEQVSHALAEQAGLGKRQIESLARLERMIGEVTRALQSHDDAAGRLRDALRDLSRTAGAHESAVEVLSGVATQLGARARALADSVGRFKV